MSFEHMSYKFRLVFYYSKPGFFRVDEESIEYSLSDSLVVSVFPRDADKLNIASKYHIESGGFPSENEARICGEKLRTHLRLLNCILDLGLSIPSVDGNSSKLSNAIKESARKEGGEILDTITGLYVFPDDGLHFEHVTSGKINVYPGDPLYTLKGLKDSWENEFELDENTQEIIEILNISVRESSPKVKFLATYLAMEQIIKRKMRSERAQELIDEFINLTKSSNLTGSEKNSLSGSLGYLKEQAFSSVFTAFAKTTVNPKEINNMSVKKFVSECISLRNKVAHNISVKKLPKLEEFTKHLRIMALSVLWTKNKFPNVSIERPGDRLEMEKMESRLL